MGFENLLEIIGVIIAGILAVVTLLSLLVIFNSDNPPEDKITGLVMLMIPTEVGIMEFLAKFGTIGAILIIAIVWFFANYVNNS